MGLHAAACVCKGMQAVAEMVWGRREGLWLWVQAGTRVKAKVRRRGRVRAGPTARLEARKGPMGKQWVRGRAGMGQERRVGRMGTREGMSGLWRGTAAGTSVQGSTASACGGRFVRASRCSCATGGTPTWS